MHKKTVLHISGFIFYGSSQVKKCLKYIRLNAMVIVITVASTQVAISSDDCTEALTADLQRSDDLLSEHADAAKAAYYLVYVSMREDALHFVVKNNLINAVRVMSENYGVNFKESINKKDKDGNTPVHYAAENGNLEMFEFLLDNGAEITEEMIKQLIEGGVRIGDTIGFFPPYD